MLTRRTPEAHAAVLARFRQFGSGMFAGPTERGVIVFPGFDGGAEWGGAAFDPHSALLYVNSNEMPWIVWLIPNNDTSLYKVNCATCHREDRKGSPSAPSLENVGQRRTREEIATLTREGTGRMPGFPDMGGCNIADLTDVLLTGVDKGADPKFMSDPNSARRTSIRNSARSTSSLASYSGKRRCRPPATRPPPPTPSTANSTSSSSAAARTARRPAAASSRSRCREHRRQRRPTD